MRQVCAQHLLQGKIAIQNFRHADRHLIDPLRHQSARRLQVSLQQHLDVRTQNIPYRVLITDKLHTASSVRLRSRTSIPRLRLLLPNSLPLKKHKATTLAMITVTRARRSTSVTRKTRRKTMARKSMTLVLRLRTSNSLCSRLVYHGRRLLRRSRRTTTTSSTPSWP